MFSRFLSRSNSAPFGTLHDLYVFPVWVFRRSRSLFRRACHLHSHRAAGRAFLASVAFGRRVVAAAHTPDAGPDAITVEAIVDLQRLPIPTTLVIDAEGVVRDIIRGPIEVD